MSTLEACLKSATLPDMGIVLEARSVCTLKPCEMKRLPLRIVQECGQDGIGTMSRFSAVEPHTALLVNVNAVYFWNTVSPKAVNSCSRLCVLSSPVLHVCDFVLEHQHWICVTTAHALYVYAKQPVHASTPLLLSRNNESNAATGSSVRLLHSIPCPLAALDKVVSVDTTTMLGYSKAMQSAYLVNIDQGRVSPLRVESEQEIGLRNAALDIFRYCPSSQFQYLIVLVITTKHFLMLHSLDSEASTMQCAGQIPLESEFASVTDVSFLSRGAELNITILLNDTTRYMIVLMEENQTVVLKDAIVVAPNAFFGGQIHQGLLFGPTTFLEIGKESVIMIQYLYQRGVLVRPFSLRLHEPLLDLRVVPLSKTHPSTHVRSAMECVEAYQCPSFLLHLLSKDGSAAFVVPSLQDQWRSSPGKTKTVLLELFEPVHVVATMLHLISETYADIPHLAEHLLDDLDHTTIEHGWYRFIGSVLQSSWNTPFFRYVQTNATRAQDTDHGVQIDFNHHCHVQRLASLLHFILSFSTTLHAGCISEALRFELETLEAVLSLLANFEKSNLMSNASFRKSIRKEGAESIVAITTRRILVDRPVRDTIKSYFSPQVAHLLTSADECQNRFQQDDAVSMLREIRRQYATRFTQSTEFETRLATIASDACLQQGVKCMILDKDRLFDTAIHISSSKHQDFVSDLVQSLIQQGAPRTLLDSIYHIGLIDALKALHFDRYAVIGHMERLQLYAQASKECEEFANSIELSINQKSALLKRASVNLCNAELTFERDKAPQQHVSEQLLLESSAHHRIRDASRRAEVQSALLQYRRKNGHDTSILAGYGVISWPDLIDMTISCGPVSLLVDALEYVNTVILDTAIPRLFFRLLHDDHEYMAEASRLQVRTSHITTLLETSDDAERLIALLLHLPTNLVLTCLIAAIENTGIKAIASQVLSRLPTETNVCNTSLIDTLKVHLKSNHHGA